jgi:hypothetical protein
MMHRTLFMASLTLIVIALALPGCRLKPRDAMPALPPEDEIPIADTGLNSVFVALHTGETGKPAGDSVTVRLRWRDQTVATESIGRGARWEPDSRRAVQLSVVPPIRMDSPGALLLEVVKTEVAPGGPPWIVEVEALGRLTDGTTLLLLDRTEPAQLGGGGATEAAWLLHSR